MQTAAWAWRILGAEGSRCPEQDDDLPPKARKWLLPALKLFSLHPRLGLISCTDGFTTAEV